MKPGAGMVQKERQYFSVSVFGRKKRKREGKEGREKEVK